MSDATCLIETRNLTKTFSSGFFRRNLVHAVDGVSLRVKKGEILGLVGESGCGKTTLGRLLLRLAEADSGEILWDGVDLRALSRRDLRRYRPGMQMIFQDADASLNPRMTIGESIAEPLMVPGTLSRSEIQQRVLELSMRVGLGSEYIYRLPRELSGGQNQRVVLARVLALSPAFIVADEPTSALDLSVQAQILGLIREIQREMNTTILFISHDFQVIRFMCDRVAVMKNGRIIEINDVEEIFTRPDDPYTQQLIESSTPARLFELLSRRKREEAGERVSST